MNDNTILRIKVPAHLYESVKKQLTINEAKGSSTPKGWTVVKEKKAHKNDMEKVEEIGGAISSNPSDMGINIVDAPGGIVTKETKEKNNSMQKKRTLEELTKAKKQIDKKIEEMSKSEAPMNENVAMDIFNAVKDLDPQSFVDALKTGLNMSGNELQNFLGGIGAIGTVGGTLAGAKYADIKRKKAAAAQVQK